MLSHFLLVAVVLTLGVILAQETRPRERTRLRRVGAVGSASSSRLAAAVLLFSGTLATASGPHPGSTVVRRLWSFQPAVYWHVRATAVFGHLVPRRCSSGSCARTRPRCERASSLLGLLLVQMAIGETQYRTHLPWWLVLVHVTMAATVWAAVTVVRLQPLAPT